MPDSPKQTTIGRQPEQRYLWILLAFAAAIRLYDLGGKQLWVDEVMQAMASSPRLSLAEVLHAVTGHVGGTPLDYVIQHYVTVALGQTEFALRLHAAVLGTATIAAVYYLFRMLLDARLALLSAALYAVYPLHHHYSQEGRPYALFALLTAFSYTAFCKVLARGRSGDWIFYVAANTLLLYGQYFGMFVLASQLLISLTMLSPGVRDSLPSFRKVDGRFLAIQTAATGAAAALFLPWVLYGVSTVRGYTPMPVHFGFKLFLSFIQEVGDGSHPLAWLLILLAILGARKLAKEKRYGLLWLLLIWLLMPIPLIFLLLWIKDYFFAIRHFIFLTPALYALVALGIVSLAERLAPGDERRRAKATALLAGWVGTVSLLVIGLHIPDRREDLRGAAQFLKQNVQPEDAIVAPEISGILAYYFPEIDQHLQPPSALSGLASEATGRNVFVVETGHMSDASKRLVEAALGKTASKREIALRDVRIIEMANSR